MIHDLLANRLPERLRPLIDLALDLRFTASRTAVGLWRSIDLETWERTENPYLILLNAHSEKLDALSRDREFLSDLERCLARRESESYGARWFGSDSTHAMLRGVAYFSMEFGLSESLPIYSGGLGFLAGDHLRSASDLGVPLVGVGLLYQQGYFCQVLAPSGDQLEAFPFNDPSSMPIQPLRGPDGRWVRVRLDLPGRTLLARTWEVRVGQVRLFLLDTNDPRNTPGDRAITANLYDAGPERRILQEILLGVGGWQLLEKLGVDAQVCHLNEGHPAFVVLARAASYAHTHGVPFQIGLRATRAGNVFTTHTPVEAAFDSFDPALVLSLVEPLFRSVGLSADQLLRLGRRNPESSGESFHMAYLAMRGCSLVNGVSRLHGETSRRLFSPLFPRLPLREVPVGYVTNGVHVGEWDSSSANRIWGAAGEGVRSWVHDVDEASNRSRRLSDVELWKFRAEARADLVQYVRRRFSRQLAERGAGPEELERARNVLDPEILTLGFARRFTEYKRPNLLLRDVERLARILRGSDCPVQLIIAGKAHPNDLHGKQMVRAVVHFTQRSDIADRAVFLEDYDLVLAQHLAGGVDVWLNHPRRPAEACGTSGMKMLVNGGLHFSTLDGWWDEAYQPGVGWALGGRDLKGPEGDAEDAEQLYATLEREIVPEFYARGSNGVPAAWVERVRASMDELTPRFSAARMLREYVQDAYVPAARAVRSRAELGPDRVLALSSYSDRLERAWPGLRFHSLQVSERAGLHLYEVEIDLGEVEPHWVRVQLYSEVPDGQIVEMACSGAVPGEISRYIYRAQIAADRPAHFYTPRVVASHPDSLGPIEHPQVHWMD